MKGVFFSVAVLSSCLCAASCKWSLSHVTPSTSSVAAPPVAVWAGGESETNKIDLLIVFDVSACRWLTEHGFSPDVYSKSCVEGLNRSIAYTGIDRHFTFRLAGVLNLSPVDFGGRELQDIVASLSSGFTSDRLDRLVVDRIRKVRDDKRADIVVILTEGKTPNIYGYGTPFLAEHLAEDGLYASAENAYCACRIDSLEQRHTLMHEVGHLFGAGHSNTQRLTPGPQLFKYSSAYRFRAGNTSLTTVTGYPEEKDGTILPFFSSPDYALTYIEEGSEDSRNIPVGTPTNDNTRTVITAYPFIAQYRAAKPTELAAQFERKLVFALSEGGRAVLGTGMAVPLRCGVRRTFAIETHGVDAKMRVLYLPPGFAYDADTRTLTGRSAKAGHYITVFAFSGNSDGMFVRKRVEFHVEPLPSWAKGTFCTEDNKRNINISDKGTIRLSMRKAYREEKTKQDGFTSEEKNVDGSPVFVFEDGKRLSRVVDGNGMEYGVIKGDDGIVYYQVKNKKQQKRRKKT